MSRSTQNRQGGFAHIILFLVIALVIGAVVYIGYQLYAKPDTSADISQTQSSTSSAAKAKGDPSASEVPNQIKSEDDLNKTGLVLDQVDPDEAGASDDSQLNAQLNDF